MGSLAEQAGRDEAISEQALRPDTVSRSNDASFGRQSLRRLVNQRLHEAVHGSLRDTIDIFCECGRRLCADSVHIELELYVGVLGSPGRYIIATHHDSDPSQRLISRHHGFLVVERS